jgi:FkbM family methyltransferase
MHGDLLARPTDRRTLVTFRQDTTVDLARHAARIAAIVVVAAAAGCSSKSAPAKSEAIPAAAQAIPSCDPSRGPNLEMAERKLRIAKGVYRGSRRIAVEGELELWDTPYGRYWVVADNFNEFADVLAEQAVEIYGDRVRGVHEGDVVLDCGAHFGGFTRTALDRGAKTIVAIEIAPENAACLRKNFASEIAAGRVIVYEKGVWDSEGTMTLERKKHTWADQVGVGGVGPSVPVTTIDKIVSDLHLPKVDFIKMDIEGAERNALAGAAETLKAFQPRMAIASYHLPDDVDVIAPLVRSKQPSYTTCISGKGLGHGYLTLFFK